MLELADIVGRYGGAYRQRFGATMPPSHRRALEDIEACRTEALGGHLYRCDHCGHQHYAYHSCRNRHCPKCHTRQTQRWLDERRAELLPVEHFHLVFTVPAPLRPLIRSRQRTLYGLLMKAAAQALIKLAADPHYVGGTIGILAVLHTWTRTGAYHPHVHCLVPAGGLSSDGTTWLSARHSYLVPVRALSKIFRGIFQELVRKHLPAVPIAQSVWGKKWVVYCKPTVQGTQTVLTYLARYVHRVALTNHRILSIDGGKVTFAYQDTGQRRWKTMTLTAEQFLRRFLQHVLPAGFHKVRYYGLWAPANRHRLRHAQTLLHADPPPAQDDPVQDDPAPLPGQLPYATANESHRSDHPRLPNPTCPRCGKGTLLWVGSIAPQPRSPP